MKPYNVNTIENWLKWERSLKENGYKPWQYQYSPDAPEGFHTWFMKPGEKDIEIVTHSKTVHDAILRYKSPGG